jgi:S1-C subfamily serine protease
MPLDKTPAKAAGLLKDDVLLSVGGANVADLLGAINLVRKAKPGDELTLRVRRAGKEIDVKVKPTVVPFTGLAGLE